MTLAGPGAARRHRRSLRATAVAVLGLLAVAVAVAGWGFHHGPGGKPVAPTQQDHASPHRADPDD